MCVVGKIDSVNTHISLIKKFLTYFKELHNRASTKNYLAKNWMMYICCGVMFAEELWF